MVRTRKQTKKDTELTPISSFIGERGRVRTADPLIKSQMLYRLSYAPINHSTEGMYRR